MNCSFSQFKATMEVGAYNWKGLSVTRLGSTTGGAYKPDFTVLHKM